MLLTPTVLTPSLIEKLRRPGYPSTLMLLNQNGNCLGPLPRGVTLAMSVPSLSPEPPLPVNLNHASTV